MTTVYLLFNTKRSRVGTLAGLRRSCWWLFENRQSIYIATGQCKFLASNQHSGWAVVAALRHVDRHGAGAGWGALSLPDSISAGALGQRAVGGAKEKGAMNPIAPWVAEQTA